MLEHQIHAKSCLHVWPSSLQTIVERVNQENVFTAGEGRVLYVLSMALEGIAAVLRAPDQLCYFVHLFVLI